MTRQEMIDLVKRYFGGVDGADFGVISETLTDDCKFRADLMKSESARDSQQH